MNRRTLLQYIGAMITAFFGRTLLKPEKRKHGDPFVRYPWLKDYGVTKTDPILDMKKIKAYDRRHKTRTLVHVFDADGEDLDCGQSINVVTSEVTQIDLDRLSALPLELPTKKFKIPDYSLVYTRDENTCNGWRNAY